MKNSSTLKSGAAGLVLYAMAAVGVIAGQTGMAHAEVGSTFAVQTVESISSVKSEGEFIRKSKRLKGNYSIIKENGQTIIRFSDNFRTVNGPDLKVFLSPQSVENVTAETATDGAVLIGFVKSKTGTQDYIVPEGVDISNFSSVLIHCEAFSVLWGGGNI